MLARSLFEDMVLACWIKWVEDPKWAIERLTAQGRHSALLWDEIIKKYPSLESRIPPSGREVTIDAWDRYQAMFGRNGATTWWAVPAIKEVPNPKPGKGSYKASGERRGLRHLINEIEKEAVPTSHTLEVVSSPSRPSRVLIKRLQYLLDVVNRTNNEVLHYTSYGYSAAYDDTRKVWRESTSEDMAPLARSTLFMTYGTIIVVMCQHGNGVVEESYIRFRERMESARPPTRISTAVPDFYDPLSELNRRR
jgi:hypothetical protein